MSGLIYEISWVRSLELIFGTTTFAVATVLAAFMGGLAGGSYGMGRLASRWTQHHPLRVYAVLECLIAISALLVPLALHALVPAYQYVWKATHASFVTFSLIRFALTAVLLLIPTFLMGATLPVVSAFVTSDKGAGQPRIGLLYSVNTLGAVLGCASAGLLLFPAVGLAMTQWVAVGLNLVAAAGAYHLAGRCVSPSIPVEATARSKADVLPPAPGSTCEVTPGMAGTARWLVGAYAISGFVAMLYEVAWSRVLVLVLGSSTYACTIMLTTFLLGLALGAWLATRWLRGAGAALRWAAFCQLGIALATYAGIRMVEEMPFFYLKIYETFHPSPRGLLSVQFLLTSTLMLLPTLGLGAMFPITIQALQPAGSRVARVVGWAYALNTIGAIAGSVLAGFWLIPQWGSQHTLLTGMMMNGALGAVLLLLVKEAPIARFRALLAAGSCLAVAVLVATATPWDPAVMSSGVFRYARDYLGLNRDGFRERARKVSGEVLLFDEGLTCTVTVLRNPECLSLLVNGKPDASTPSGLTNPYDTNAPALLLDLPTQILLGQIPMLLAPRREDALVIGLGSGLTVGSVLTHPVKRVDCVELESAVVRGSRFFEEFNHRPLSDPRTELVVNDARNHLLVTDRTYDVIISEPSNPWIPGAANLFTREFFDISRARLRPDGVFCQWIQMYELEPAHFQTILRTFRTVFPEAHLFRVNHDAILVGSLRPRRISARELAERFLPEVRSDLSRIHIASVEDLLARYWVGGAELQALTDLPAVECNTDDNMRIEFAAPLQILAGPSPGTGSRPGIAALFDGHTSGAIPHVDLSEPAQAPEFWARVAAGALRERMPETLIYADYALGLKPNARAAAVKGVALMMRGQSAEAQAFLEQFLEQFPENAELSRALAMVCAQRRDWTATRRYAERWVQQSPTDPLGWFQLGRSLFYLDQRADSRAAFDRISVTARHDEELRDLPFYLGALQVQQGDYRAGAENFRAFLRHEPAHLEARVQFAEALFRSGQAADAAVQWQRVAQLNTTRAAQLQHEATADWQLGRRENALQNLEQARRLDPANADLALQLARLRVLSGNAAGASDTLAQYLAAFPDRAPVVGYLGQLLKSQARTEEARLYAARYRALTGTAWEDVPDE